MLTVTTVTTVTTIGCEVIFENILQEKVLIWHRERALERRRLRRRGGARLPHCTTAKKEMLTALGRLQGGCARELFRV